jgi:hypothetical protein
MSDIPRMAVVEQRLAEVTASLNTATGGAALCRIDGTGGSAKSLEGRMAALLEVRRTLRRDPDADLSAIADRWHADLELRRAKGSSAAWTDYLSAGAAELASLVAHAPGDASPKPGSVSAAHTMEMTR